MLSIIRLYLPLITRLLHTFTNIFYHIQFYVGICRQLLLASDPFSAHHRPLATNQRGSSGSITSYLAPGLITAPSLED